MAKPKMEELFKFSEPDTQELYAPVLGLDKSIRESKERAKRESMKQYIHRFDESFFTDFVRYFITPFLKKHGYRTYSEEKVIVRNLKWWCAAHYYVSQNKSKALHVNYVSERERGEDYDWFLYCVPLDELSKELKYWIEDDFFDDSECGHAQRTEFHTFLWENIDLMNSESHLEWLEFTEDHEEEDDTNQRSSNDTYALYEKRKHKNELY